MASSGDSGGGQPRSSGNKDARSLFSKVWMCIPADDKRQMDKLITDHTELWNEGAVHNLVEGGDSGRTLLSFALEKGSANCAGMLMDCGCDPNKAIRNALENVMSDKEKTAVVGVKKITVKGYEDVLEWEDTEAAQKTLIDMYDHGLSATAEDVKEALNALFWDYGNPLHVEERNSWISSKSPSLLLFIIIMIMISVVNNNNNNNNNNNDGRHG